MLRYLNLTLLVLFPLSWFAPLLRAGVLPLFGLSEITVISSIQSLWATDVILALLVTALALVFPLIKVLGTALVDFHLADPRLRPALGLLGKLAMADVFLIALYVVVIKGIGIGRVEVAWGLYAFTACILASIILSMAASRNGPNR